MPSASRATATSTSRPRQAEEAIPQRPADDPGDRRRGAPRRARAAAISAASLEAPQRPPRPAVRRSRFRPFVRFRSVYNFEDDIRSLRCHPGRRPESRGPRAPARARRRDLARWSGAALAHRRRTSISSRRFPRRRSPGPARPTATPLRADEPRPGRGDEALARPTRRAGSTGTGSFPASSVREADRMTRRTGRSTAPRRAMTGVPETSRRRRRFRRPPLARSRSSRTLWRASRRATARSAPSWRSRASWRSRRRAPSTRGSRPGSDLPLAGVPLAVKDNIWVAGRQATCASRILEGFRPARRLDRRGAPAPGRRRLRRPGEHGRVRDGLLDREQREPRDPQSVGPRARSRAAPRAAARRPSRRASCRAASARTPAARSASRPPAAASSGSSRPTAASRATASSRSPPRSTRSGR